MIDILFIAQNKHQYDYFKLLSQNIPFKCKVFTPSLPLYSLKKYDISYKLKEIQSKYPNNKAKLYSLYIKTITPYFGANYEFAIKRYNPKIVALWNGIKYPQNIAKIIAKKLNKKLLFFENGFLPKRTQVDCKGVNALNSVIRDYNFYKNLSSYNELPKALEKREFVGKQITTNTSLPNEYIFVPFQVAYDSQIIQFSNFKGMEELFFLISEIANKLKKHFIFKEHPSDRVSNYEKLHKIAQKHPFIDFANNIDTQSLIQNAKAIITINSSVGMEALLFEKKVFVLGEAFYAIDGISIKANKKNLLEKLQEDPPIDFSVVKKFLGYLYYEYLVADSWENPSQAHFDGVSKKVLKCLQ